jgi:general secretion pathway protein F
MPEFRYVAIAPGGALTQGVMEADDAAAVIARLRHEGSIPMRAEPATKGGLGDMVPSLHWGNRGLRRQEVVELTRELAVMLAAGQDLDRALRFLIETATRPRVVRVLNAVRDAVRDGSSFAAALAQDNASFPRLYVGLVRAGEAGGALATTLERLATLLERERALAATVTSALIYPAMLLLAAIGSVVLLLTYVLPQFVPLFEQSGAPLPASTQLMISAGDLLTSYGSWALMLLALLTMGGMRLLRRPGPRLAVDRLRLRLPVIGGLAREALAARLTRTLGTLLINGMPLISALDIVRDALGNAAGVQALEAATVAARGGAGLARPLAASGIFPARTVHLLQLGEETAQLGPMALRAAEIHEEKTRLAVQRLVSLLTPAITIGMGGLIAAIVGSLMQAMIGLNDLAH